MRRDSEEDKRGCRSKVNSVGIDAGLSEVIVVFVVMIRRPPISTQSRSSARQMCIRDRLHTPTAQPTALPPPMTSAATTPCGLSAATP